MLDVNSENRFIQFELWKDCKNGCKFCFNRGLPDINKIDSLNFVIEKLSDPIIDKFNEIGFIGGEFFDDQLNDIGVRNKFYNLFDKVCLFMNSGKMNKLYVTSSLIFDNQSSIFEFLDFLRIKGCLSKTLLCTSYDFVGRFHTIKHKSMWIKNMKDIHIKYPELKLHTEIIITQRFIEDVLNGVFQINEFKEEFNTSIDYLEPNTGSFYDGKHEFDKNVPGFLPKRDDFIRFLKKTCIQDKSIELFKLFSKKIRSDMIYLILNGKHVEICGRRNGSRLMGINLPILPKFGYIDSDIDIADDVSALRSVYEQ